MTIPVRRLTLASVALASVLVLAACGGGSTGDPTPSRAPTSADEPPPAATRDGSAPVDQPTASVIPTQAGADEGAQADSEAGSLVRPTAARPSGPRPTVRPSNFDADGDGYLSWSELGQAVAATIGDYEWPPNYRVTADLMLDYFSAGQSMEENRFEVDYENTLISGYHQCAWEQTWLDARAAGDDALEAKALDIMTNVVPNDISVTEMRDFLINMAQKAALGDPSLIIRDLELNCAGLPFVTPPATPDA